MKMIMTRFTCDDLGCADYALIRAGEDQQVRAHLDLVDLGWQIIRDRPWRYVCPRHKGGNPNATHPRRALT